MAKMTNTQHILSNGVLQSQSHSTDNWLTAAARDEVWALPGTRSKQWSSICSC